MKKLKVKAKMDADLGHIRILDKKWTNKYILLRKTLWKLNYDLTLIFYGNNNKS